MYSISCTSLNSHTLINVILHSIVMRIFCQVGFGSWGSSWVNGITPCAILSAMTRQWRIEFEGAYYHILSRGNERRNVFKEFWGYHT
ncbi:hypothetical protein KSU1_B0072 [Candidatus Jettenia caeni]|uniref:Transposase n=1 Tax=Candidatus Jettenia caeni TaxID=247490 RepID=I3IGT4_9BACT|nr:hypothetical protein KSU1_B0072 [Candidatus Jettenia caeni]